MIAWTPELIERVRFLWKQGVPAKQIATLIGQGATKNSVIGKVHRLKLPMRHMPPGTHPRGVNRPTRHDAKRLQRKPSRPKPAPPPKPLPPPPPPPPPPKPQRLPGTFTLLDLGRDHCRWPVNSPERGEEYLFCGLGQFNGHPYCETHARLGFSGKGTARQTAVAGWFPKPVAVR